MGIILTVAVVAVAFVKLNWKAVTRSPLSLLKNSAKRRKTAHTFTMKRLKLLSGFLWAKYRLLTVKKYTTIAGTLVFFLLMSIVPMAFWAALLFGKLPIDSGKMLSLSVFSSVMPVLDTIRREAETATSGASMFLIATSLYSATSLFYHMRKSGELIYGSEHSLQGLKMRLGAVALLFCVMFVVLLALLSFAMLALVVNRILTGWIERALQYFLLILIAFLVVTLLNIYVCPYKAPLKYFLIGTAFTVVFWFAAVWGFSVYLQLSNVSRLYGAFSTLIVFMLWLYVMMIGFVIGIILNSERIQARYGRPREGFLKRKKSKR